MQIKATSKRTSTLTNGSSADIFRDSALAKQRAVCLRGNPTALIGAELTYTFLLAFWLIYRIILHAMSYKRESCIPRLPFRLLDLFTSPLSAARSASTKEGGQYSPYIHPSSPSLCPTSFLSSRRLPSSPPVGGRRWSLV